MNKRLTLGRGCHRGGPPRRPVVRERGNQLHVRHGQAPGRHPTRQPVLRWPDHDQPQRRRRLRRGGRHQRAAAASLFRAGLHRRRPRGRRLPHRQDPRHRLAELRARRRERRKWDVRARLGPERPDRQTARAARDAHRDRRRRHRRRGHRVRRRLFRLRRPAGGPGRHGQRRRHRPRHQRSGAHQSDRRLRRRPLGRDQRLRAAGHVAGHARRRRRPGHAVRRRRQRPPARPQRRRLRQLRRRRRGRHHR